jgi:hypothetical protein
MKTVAAIVLGGLLLVPGVAMASSATDAALGLGAFAVFNQILSGTGIFGGVVARPVVVAPQPVVVAPPPPPVYVAPPGGVTPPPVIVAPRPVIMAPRPVVVAPPVYAPVPVYRDHIYHRAYGHRWGWDHRYDRRH